MSRKPTTPDEMRIEAARLREYVARLNRESERASANAPGSYITGASGRSKAQNKATNRALEKTINNAVKAVAATKRADELERQADYIEADGPALLEARIATRRAQDAAERKAAKAALKSGPLAARLFQGVYSCGMVYADRAVERDGDYRRLAFLPYDTLQIEYENDCPELWRPFLEQKVAEMLARAGQPFALAQNMSITLGTKINERKGSQ